MSKAYKGKNTKENKLEKNLSKCEYGNTPIIRKYKDLKENIQRD